jgi:hypothetical protein
MPVPLIWLGAAAVSLYTANKLNASDLRQRNIISRLPGDCREPIAPVNGSIVTCGVYELLDHTGIWIDGNIYELKGNGLVRCISPDRFLQNRSGDQIYVACNMQNQPLVELNVVARTKSQLYSLHEYHLLRQNCHKFVAEMVSGYPRDITSFSELNEFISDYFSSPVDWRLTQINNQRSNFDPER